MDGCAIVTPAKSENRSHKKDMKEPTKEEDLPMLCQDVDDVRKYGRVEGVGVSGRGWTAGTADRPLIES